MPSNAILGGDVFPFQEQKLGGSKVVRTFSEDVESSELIWHRDKEERIVTILEGDEWGLQLDNQMPLKLQVGKQYIIPQEEWHRVIKGRGNLVIEILKKPRV